MGTIKEIDKDNNGYVTKTEMEDILKLKYPEHFEMRDLIPIIKKFSSIQNKILIDYKGFRDWVRLGMKNGAEKAFNVEKTYSLEKTHERAFSGERAKSVSGKRPSVTAEMKQMMRPNSSMGNSRTQSRLRNATAQDQMMNNDGSKNELGKANDAQMYRKYSLSNFKESKSPVKN
jgi:hypothetical protein